MDVLATMKVRNSAQVRHKLVRMKENDATAPLHSLISPAAVPGASMASIRDGALTMTAVGVRDNETGEPVNDQTVYGHFLAAVLRGDGLKEATSEQWLIPAIRATKGVAEHLEDMPAETEQDIGWGLGWGLEPSGV